MKKSKKKSEPKSAEACWNCEDDPDGKLKQMFVDIVQTRRIRQGQTPARRPAATSNRRTQWISAFQLKSINYFLSRYWSRQRS